MGAPQSKEPKTSGKSRGKSRDNKPLASVNIFTEHNGMFIVFLIDGQRLVVFFDSFHAYGEPTREV